METKRNRKMRVMRPVSPDGIENPPLHVEVADSFWTRFLGLMGRRRLPEGQGLLIVPCSSIHMCFMRFAIDAVYLDREYRVIRVAAGLRPWTGFSWCSSAWAVLELPSGEARRFGLKQGVCLR